MGPINEIKYDNSLFLVRWYILVYNIVSAVQLQTMATCSLLSLSQSVSMVSLIITIIVAAAARHEVRGHRAEHDIH